MENTFANTNGVIMYIKLKHQATLGGGFLDIEGINPTSIEDLFTNREKYLSMLPTDKQYNVHYSIHEYTDKEGEENSCYLYPLDFDGFKRDIGALAKANKQEWKELYTSIATIVSARTKVDISKLGIVCSGNGIHILILSRQGFYVKDMSDIKQKMSELSADISVDLLEKNIYCNIDLQPLRPHGTLRLPGTDNVKEDRETRSTFVIQDPVPTDFALITSDYHEYIENGEVSVDAVLNGCNFLKQCITYPEKTTREEWFMATGILAYLPNGEALAHQYWGQDSDRYNFEETESLLRGWKESYGAPKCSTIEVKTSFNCRTCKHYGKCRTPLGIIPEGTIPSERQGFRKISKTKSGEIRYGEIYFEDLAAAFTRDYGDYVVTIGSHTIYTWKDTQFTELPTDEVIAYAMEKVAHCEINKGKEFPERLTYKRPKLIRADKLNQGKGKINFLNGILDMGPTEERLIPHDKAFLFTHTLAYNYEPTAQCPKFRKFMCEITLNDEKMQETIMEFVGYGLSGDPSSLAQKAMFFVGEGQNGKSTLTKIIENLAGKPGYSSVLLEKLDDENLRRSMVGKLFNISSETKSTSLKNSEMFKMIAAGESVTIKELYSDKTEVHINAKLITACNKMPITYDSSNGTYRRILYIPFDATFPNPDPELADRILADEVPGIIAWAVLAYKRLRANKYKFTVSERSEKQVEEYKSENPIHLFVDDCVDYKLDSMLSMADLYKCYSSYCKENNYTVVQPNVLSRELKSVLNRSFQDRDPAPEPFRNAKNRGIKHIKLRTLNDPIKEIESRI